MNNIETSPATLKIPKSLEKYSYFGTRLLDDLYSNDSIKTMHIYKCLSQQTGQAIKDFASEVITDDRGQKLIDCGTYIVTDKDNKVVAANFCRQRICPLCQKRKSMKTYADFKQILDELKDNVFLHLVLTVPNVYADKLAETIDRMQVASSRFFRMGDLKKAFKGIARCTEVSYNPKRKDWHPHFHCLIAVNKSYATSRDYIKQQDLRRWWSAAWIVSDKSDIDNATDELLLLYSSFLKNKPDKLLQVFITKADEGALPEIAKYAVKPLAIDLEMHKLVPVLEELFPALHGRRLVQLYGIIKETAHKLNIEVGEESAENETTNEASLNRMLWGFSSDTHCFGYFMR